MKCFYKYIQNIAIKYVSLVKLQKFVAGKEESCRIRHLPHPPANHAAEHFEQQGFLLRVGQAAAGDESV
jgi:hypothetical protein